MSALLFNGIQKVTRLLTTKYVQVATMHCLTKQTYLSNPELKSSCHKPILEPNSLQIQHNRGLKYKARLHLRCKDCYFEVIDDVLHVQCKTHGRHKQRKFSKKPRNSWIITSICNSNKREW